MRRALNGAVKSFSNTSFKVGDRFHGFVLNQCKPISVYDMTYYKFIHEKIKSQYFHINSGREEKTFAIMFRTPPIDDTGTSHILERLIAYGAKKFPVRNLFKNMKDRSLSTYMNGWIGPDFTIYVFSSTNNKDMLNLLSLYSEAIFFPLLRYEDFLQEAHRIQSDQLNRLYRTGNTYNEMKNRLLDPNEYFTIRLLQNLFQSSPYKFNSSGDPLFIPDLTYEKLIDYHKSFYHPSNAYFFSFGNIDFTPYLETIEKDVMSQFKELSKINTQISREPQNTNQVRIITEKFMPDENRPITHQGIYAVSRLCNESYSDPYKTFALKILAKLLLDGSNSPMYKALIESKLGDSYCPAIGYDASFRDSLFTLGVQGCLCEQTHFHHIDNAIFNTLQQAKDTKFSEDDFNRVIQEITYNTVIFL